MRKEIVEALEKKGTDLKLNKMTFQNWKKGYTRMYVDKVEEVFQNNNIPEPFFWDGTIEDFQQFAKKCGAKLGLTIKFE